MNFNGHDDFKGLHAFLSPSSSHWINYDEEKLDTVYLRSLAVKKGTDLHELASRCIQLKVKMPRSNKAFDKYVNDAIGFRMQPEQVLFYSSNCFGTADAISFDKKFLRIHDLKTGTIITSMRQLEVYAALFCLEYDMSPYEITIELRKYQLDQVMITNPDPSDIRFIMDKIIEFNKRIELLKLEG